MSITKTQKSLSGAKNSLKTNDNIISKQIGCGYCMDEHRCKIHLSNKRINYAKQGCKEFIHHNSI